jgi:hypothetical protein
MLARHFGIVQLKLVAGDATDSYAGLIDFEAKPLIATVDNKQTRHNKPRRKECPALVKSCAIDEPAS